MTKKCERLRIMCHREGLCFRMAPYMRWGRYSEAIGSGQGTNWYNILSHESTWSDSAVLIFNILWLRGSDGSGSEWIFALFQLHWIGLNVRRRPLGSLNGIRIHGYYYIGWANISILGPLNNKDSIRKKFGSDPTEKILKLDY